MNYRTTIDPVGIYSTGAAVDNVEVFGSLKMARAALYEVVDAELKRASDSFAKDTEMLRVMIREKARDLRAQRKLALKVREADLPSDATIPVFPVGDAQKFPPSLDSPPAAPVEHDPVCQETGSSSDCPACLGNSEPFEPTAGTGDDDLLSLKGTHLDRSAKRKPAA